MLVLLVWVGTPIASKLVGHGPNDPFPYAVDPVTLEGVGPWTWVPDVNTYAGDVAAPPEGGPQTLMVLGSDGQLGRDLMLRLLDGGKVTLTVAIGGTLLAMLIGVGMGLLAAWQGGIVDSGVGRLTEFVMAFPLLFFAILAASTFGDQIDGITLGVLRPGVLSFILIIGLFTWFYPARIIRTEARALSGQEFVEAARMVGASDWRILRSHLLPHLVPTMIVYSTLLVATNILLEAGLSFLGFGIELPTASWGSILSTTWGAGRSASAGAGASLTVDPWLTVFPSLVIFGTVLALNLLGDGLRAAFDPDGGRP